MILCLLLLTVEAELVVACNSSSTGIRIFGVATESVANHKMTSQVNEAAKHLSEVVEVTGAAIGNEEKILREACEKLNKDFFDRTEGAG